MENIQHEEEGSQIFFRALFGVGSVVYRRLPQLRSICEASDGQLWVDWVTVLGEELARYAPTRANPTVWVGDAQDILTMLANGPIGRDEPAVAAWLKSVSGDLSDPICSDIDSQLEALNERAFQTACELFENPSWASPDVALHWGTKSKLKIERVFESGVSCFHPSTDVRNGKILVRLEKGAINKRYALLSLLTLHFQLVHEYVSHVLPVFKAVSLSEEFLMAVLYDLYPHHGVQDGIEACLADVLDRDRPDEHAKVRATLRVVSSLVGRDAFARLVLQIAVTPETDFSDARKRSLLSRISKFAALNIGRRAACRTTFDKLKLDAIDLERLNALLAIPN